MFPVEKQIHSHPRQRTRNLKRMTPKSLLKVLKLKIKSY